MRKFAILLVLMLISCKEKEVPRQLDSEFTVVPDINHIARDSTGNYTEMRSDYYSDKNFIIDETGKIFFFGRRKYREWNCVVENISNLPIPRPEFIDLDPAEIIEIPENSIEDLIKLNTTKDEHEWNLPIIASARDTFSSGPLEKLLTQMYKHKKTLHVIRRMTEEEKIVMRYKKSGEQYFHEDIQWDTTKIILPKVMKNEASYRKIRGL